MNDTNEPRVISLWRYCELRCEYWEDGASCTLRLYMDTQLVESHAAISTFQTLQQSASWLQAVKGTLRGSETATGLAAVSERRRHDRRTATRAGRRSGDACQPAGIDPPPA
jgi:hypothetical protein